MTVMKPAQSPETLNLFCVHNKRSPKERRQRSGVERNEKSERQREQRGQRDRGQRDLREHKGEQHRICT
jgi:hypothetical protein